MSEYKRTNSTQKNHKCNVHFFLPNIQNPEIYMLTYTVNLIKSLKLLRANRFMTVSGNLSIVTRRQMSLELFNQLIAYASRI